MAFRGTMKLLTNFPKPGTPSQIVLNRIKDVGQQQTTEQVRAESPTAQPRSSTHTLSHTWFR
jgi:hypothetical protein